jgi:hypothetical protein
MTIPPKEWNSPQGNYNFLVFVFKDKKTPKWIKREALNNLHKFPYCPLKETLCMAWGYNPVRFNSKKTSGGTL